MDCSKVRRLRARGAIRDELESIPAIVGLVLGLRGARSRESGGTQRSAAQDRDPRLS